MKKVFAFLSLVVGLGLSSLAMAQGNIDYSGLCKWDETATPRGGQDRVVRSLSFVGATTVNGQALLAQLVRVAGSNATSQTAINFDRTSEKPVQVTKGNVITVIPSFYNLHWTHFYLYIDYNHDGQFGTDELVSFTHYREGTSGNFVNSAGESFSSGDVRNNGRMPVFTIPQSANVGLMRARFKADWNSKDPCGDPELGNNRGTICDFALEVLGEEDPTNTGETVRFTVNVEGEGTAKIFNVLTEAEVTNLEALENNDDLLELRPVPYDGWELTGLTVDGRDAMGDLNEKGYLDLMPDSDKTIKVKFERIMETLVYEFNAEGGSVKASLEEDGTPIPSGSKAPLYAKVLYEVEANEGYMLSSVARRNTPDVNVLDKMSKIADNVYVVPVGEDDPGFIFTFIKTDSIEDIKALGYTVRTSKAGVVVEGVSVGTLVELYNVAGVRVAKAIASEAQVALPAAQGMYVLKVGKATAKVAVR